MATNPLTQQTTPTSIKGWNDLTSRLAHTLPTALRQASIIRRGALAQISSKAGGHP